MSEDELQAIRERAVKATTGPWQCVAIPAEDQCLTLPHDHWDIYHPSVLMVPVEGQPNTFRADMSDVRFINVACASFSAEDAEFVAAARSDIPRLLAEIDRLRRASAGLDLREAARVVAHYGTHPASQLLANGQPSGLVAVATRDLEALRTALSGEQQAQTKEGFPRCAECQATMVLINGSWVCTLVQGCDFCGESSHVLHLPNEPHAADYVCVKCVKRAMFAPAVSGEQAPKLEVTIRPRPGRCIHERPIDEHCLYCDVPREQAPPKEVIPMRGPVKESDEPRWQCEGCKVQFSMPTSTSFAGCPACGHSRATLVGGVSISGRGPLPQEPMRDLYEICCAERQRLADTLAEVVRERDELRGAALGRPGAPHEPSEQERRVALDQPSDEALEAGVAALPEHLFSSFGDNTRRRLSRELVADIYIAVRKAFDGVGLSQAPKEGQ